MKTSQRHLSAKSLILTVLAISLFFTAPAFGVQLTATPVYTNLVHNFINSSIGNYTYVEKPIFPVLINNNEIPVGENWTIVVPLQKGHNYHVYCYGAWINTSSTAKTDYDFYVFGPNGDLVSSHTESAGLPPHLGTTTEDALFTPTQSGNYSFVISNNPYDSQGAQQATFVIIENFATNTWQTSYLEGSEGNSSNLNAYSAYEFVTNSSRVELYINVPSTLDIYEARLYLMNSPNSPTLNNYPLAWEPGLYGNLSDSVGGYNFQSDGYRGVAYASEEYNGQPMLLNYTASTDGPYLYYLVLIGEQGSGNINLMMKTCFDTASLIPNSIPSRVTPNNPTQISYTSNVTTLTAAQLFYTIDNWATSSTLNMQISNQTCNATIPGQSSGTLVQYRIDASDVLKNSLEAVGNYTVKQLATLNIAIANDKIRYNDNITVTGTLTPSFNDSIVQVQFCSANAVKTINCCVSSDGSFEATFKPVTSGTWAVSATAPETENTYSCDSQQLTITVPEPPVYVKYSLFVLIGLSGAVAAGAMVYFLKFRRS